ncbi:hypothetical protein CO082_04280 [Candidatus Peregrinibacteria bacterium CG_4_9_14_0_8_um_filter_44_15]|nr:MAG: hypothetical protein CO082_04280 [Candidatus Peregrinibacteria bacterium CG_4_9_14_0_8_um_filter_44_15]
MSMTESPQAAPVHELLLASRDRILATKPLVDALPPGSDPNLQRVLAGHYDYLVGNGVMTAEGYQAMWSRCTESGDFSELALAMSHAIMARQKQYLADNPNLHQSGDEVNPGIKDINAGIFSQQNRQAAIRAFIATPGNKVAITHIGSPPPREAPDWILYVQQQNMTMSEVYAALEE